MRNFEVANKISNIQNFKTMNASKFDQYNKCKEQYENVIVMFRVGDFYEFILEDAEAMSKLLGITLCCYKENAVGKFYQAMFPHYQLDAYLPKIIRAGHRVCICDGEEE